MSKKDIIIGLIDKGVKARAYGYWGVMGYDGKIKAPQYNKFVHGVRDAAVSLGVLTLEEAIKAENQASDKYDLRVTDVLPDEKVNLVKLPEEDWLTSCSYKRHITKAIILRAISLLCGICIGYMSVLF